MMRKAVMQYIMTTKSNWARVGTVYPVQWIICVLDRGIAAYGTLSVRGRWVVIGNTTPRYENKLNK